MTHARIRPQSARSDVSGRAASEGDVAQASARGQHFYDMAALKAIINREGQLVRVKHDVKLIRDALTGDPSTNVDTLVKGSSPTHCSPRGECVRRHCVCPCAPSLRGHA